ncbi:uncharacterized protein [Temnothorax longispinosus]|uniref:Selenoprotein Pa n=1 Tax=Temnothorax longispinosus TaxID=300112 RepID=A0A4S2L107_9HYME|nr:Selenoprotein Pa [Temnothorax longispinosus]
MNHFLFGRRGPAEPRASIFPSRGTERWSVKKSHRDQWCAMLALAKIALFVVALFFVSFVEAKYGFFSRVLRSSSSSDDDQSWDLSSAWERRGDRYLEQCRFVDAWKEHLGYVSVLAFLDTAWHYSFRQAVMLELLSLRLRKSGFPDIRFFVITPPSDSMENERSEDDLEIEVWRQIEAKHSFDMESLVNNDFLKSNESGIVYLQDDPQSRLWERFGASRDQVITIDRCGKLTYDVMMPWSILFFPYVKGAILSTYEEDPCGGCDFQPTIHQAPSHEEQLTTGEEKVNPEQSKTDANIDAIWTTESLEDAILRHESSSEEGREASTASSIPLEEVTNDTDHPIVSIESPTESTTYRYNTNKTESQFDEGGSDLEDRNTTPENTENFGDDVFLPLRIILYAPHVHKNSEKAKKHSHLILTVGDPDLHGHLDSEVDVASPTDSWRGADSSVEGSEEWRPMETDVNQNYTFDKDESPGLYGEVAEYWRNYEYSDIIDRNETFNDTYNNSTEHLTDVNDHTKSFSKPEESYSVASITEDPNVESSTDSQNIVGSNTMESSRPNNMNQVDREEEQDKLITEHYKKLIPWLDYRLSK